MAGKKVSVVRSILFVALVMSLQGLAFAGVTIRISNVPDKLSFPLPEGSNVVLTADTSPQVYRFTIRLLNPSQFLPGSTCALTGKGRKS